MPLDRSPDLVTFTDVKTDVQPDLSCHSTMFTYNGDDGLVAGVTLNVEFTISSPLSVSWPVIKDFNLWQEQSGLTYSAVVGDLAKGDKFHISVASDSNVVSDADVVEYEVLRVIPGHVIALDQPVPKVAEIGLGRVPSGCHFLFVEEIDGETKLTMYMEHESLMALAADVDETSADSALAAWREVLDEGTQRWYDDYVPTLRKRVAEAA